ncbi:MAG: alkaline phosphatase family protein, partial [Candidatus Eisenbacteria sp.]|nr:alkaline phosphatase family protein [Candidatus Eisenbacteria bacterium]
MFAVVLAAALIAGVVAGCGERGPGAGGRILMVGIDSADWDVIGPLMDEGKLPNLAALVESGVSCDLHSLEPKQKSPTIWATIATGKLPEKHGITDYVDPLTKNLMTSNVRTARTFWDIIGERGMTVTVVGWLVSWPADAVNGYMVTDYFRYSPRPDRPLPEHLTYPEDLLDEVESLRVVSEDITDEDLDRFIDLDAAMTADEAQRLPVDQMFAEMRAISEIERRALALSNILAGDRTFLSVTRHLMRGRPTDVSIVYLRGVDTASHKFWADAHPGEVGFPVSQTESRVFGGTVARYYEYADEMLGFLVDDFGDGTVIVCSDHGFEGPKPGQPPGGINDHGPLGILVMSGDAFKDGVQIPERSVRDVTPTIL